MYTMKETSPGHYSLNLPLPPGRYQYVFYDNGLRRAGSNINDRAWDSNGNAVSTATVK
jgi:hypothetical protein